MNTEMQNFKQVYEEMLKERETIQAKARKYDELKEAIKELKANIESYCNMNCPYSEKQREFMCRACMMGDAINLIDSHTEELI